MFPSLRHKKYRTYWIGSIFLQITSEMLNLAMSWQLYQMTHSPFSLGLVGLARFLPVLIFSLISGHISDKYSRRRVVIISQLSQLFVSIFAIGIVWSNLASPLFFYALIFVNATLMVFGNPSRQALLPALVPREDYLNAISVGQLSYQIAVVLGPSVAGFVIAAYGITPVFVVHTLSIFIGLICLYYVGAVPQEIQTKSHGGLQSIRDGLSFVKRSRLIWSTMFIDFFATFFASAMTLMPVFASDILHVGPQGLGFLYAAPSVGAVVAGLLFNTKRKIALKGRTIVVAIIIYGLMTCVFGLSRNFALSLVAMSLVGAADMISSIIRSTLRQIITPDHIRGRMISINMIFYMGGPQLGEVESGLSAILIGTPATVVVGGVATIIATIFFALRVPELLTFEGR